ncbi:MAG: MBL fold metallo-hydrolase [Clostridiaceae bacterium]
MSKFYCLNLGITKCYLLKCIEGYLLIDTGYYTDYEKFNKQLEKINIKESEIKYLLLTHHHDDHAGFVAKLVEKTDCKVITHQNAIANLKEGRSEHYSKPVNNRIKFVFSIFGLFHRKFEFPSVNIKEGDIVISKDESEVLKGIGIDGRILYTPGHTKDSISVVLSDGSAFVGDAAMNFLKFCGIKYRPIYIYDIDEVYKSWARLKEEGVKVVYPAHGNPFDISKLKVDF